MPGYFITGTDTEIGKTFVSALLIKLLVEEGLQVTGMKPVASGAKIIEGVLKNDDALSLIEASNVDTNYTNINPYVFKAAVSPHVAAEEAEIEIDFKKIKSHFNILLNKSDAIVVEGVGGWYAPLSDYTTVADLAAELDLPVILVVGLRLGCLNHALLTAQAIRQSGLSVAGWIANFVEKDFLSADKNISTLKEHLNDFPFLGSVSYQSRKDNSVLNHTINKQRLINSLSLKK